MVNRCLFIVDQDRKILVETGFGKKRDPKYYQFKYIVQQTNPEDLIRKIGFQPDEITDVLFTHLHDDHCGGAVSINDNGNLYVVFPNATHWISHKQWISAYNPNKREAAAFFRDNTDLLQQNNLIRFVEQEQEILPNISVLLRDGHTAGQMLPMINAGNQLWFYTSDFIPSIAHIPPVWVASVDVQPIIALQEKEEFLQFAEKQQVKLVFEHDASHVSASIAKSIKGFEGIDPFMQSADKSVQLLFCDEL